MAENPQHEEDVAEQSSVEFDNLRNTLDLLRANLDSIGNLIKTLPTPLTNLPATNDMFSQLQLAQGCVKSLTTATELMDELYLSLRVHNHEQTLRARPSLSRDPDNMKLSQTMFSRFCDNGSRGEAAEQ